MTSAAVGTATDEHSLDVLPAELVAEDGQCPDQGVHAVLVADLTQIGDDEAPAARQDSSEG